MGEAAADRAVMPVRDDVEQVAQLRDDQLEVAVHRQDVPAARSRVAVLDRSPDASRRRALDQTYPRVLRRQATRDGRGPVVATVVDDDDLGDVRVVRLAQTGDEAADVHLLVAARHHDGRRSMEARVLGEVDGRPPPSRRAPLGRPDVERPAGLAHPGQVLEHERGLLDRRDQSLRRASVHDVVGDDLDLREALMRRGLHQPVLAHPDLTARVPRPASHRRDQALREHLRVPVVRLEEQQLAAGLEHPVDVPEVLGVPVVTEDRRADHVVHALGRQRVEVLEQADLGVRKPALERLLGVVGVEHGGGDGILGPQRRHQMLGPETAAGAQLQDRLSRQHVKALPDGDRSPPQLDRGRRGVSKPVRLARALHLSQVVDQRHRDGPHPVEP